MAAVDQPFNAEVLVQVAVRTGHVPPNMLAAALPEPPPPAADAHAEIHLDDDDDDDAEASGGPVQAQPAPGGAEAGAADGGAEADDEGAESDTSSDTSSDAGDEHPNDAEAAAAGLEELDMGLADRRDVRTRNEILIEVLTPRQ